MWKNEDIGPYMKNLKLKIKHWVKVSVEFILNPRLILCCGIAWFITNGWVYVASALAAWLKINWLGAIAAAYLAALWFPFTPEKIITIIIAIFLLKLFFPNDQKTLKRLYDMKRASQEEIKKLKIKLKIKKDCQD